MTNIQQKRIQSSLYLLRSRYSMYGNLISQFLLDLDNGKASMDPGVQLQYYKSIRNKLGDLYRRGPLQAEIDKLFDNVLKQLRKDFPYFTWQQILVFSLTMANIPDRLIAHLAHIRSQKMVWVVRNQMLDAIRFKNVQRRDEYLMLIGYQQLSRTTSVGGIRS